MFERGQRRFLVADEVGLGKTKIARYVVAETIRRLWDDADVDRIDVVYICSNGQIARQNVSDLNVLSDVPTRAADRITMLPAALAHLSRTPVNLVAFTPATSLTFGHAGGQARERAMLFHILSHERALGPSLMSPPRCDIAPLPRGEELRRRASLRPQRSRSPLSWRAAIARF